MAVPPEEVERLNEKMGLVTVPENAKEMGFWRRERGLFGWDAARERMAAEVVAKRGIMTQSQTDACVLYMGGAAKCAYYLGFASCRLCGVQLGVSDMLTPDKKWIFPEKWQHYILKHGVKPDEAFIKDAVAWRD